MQLNRYFTIAIKNVDSSLATANNEIILTSAGEELYIQSGVISSDTEFGIAEGSMNLEEILCDSDFTLGEFNATKFEVELYNISFDLGGCPIEVTCTHTDTGVVENIFMGIIDSSTTDNNNFSRNIVAYDMSYYVRDKDISTTWNAYWDSKETSTVKALRQHLVESVGLKEVTGTYINDDLTITKPDDFTSVTLNDILPMLCELQGTIPHVNRDGKLEYVTLGTDSIATLSDDDYESASIEFSDYTTSKLTGIKVYSTSDDCSQQYPANAGTNAYIMSGNIFLLNMIADEINTALEPVWYSIQNIQYSPVTVPMIVGSVEYKLGDYFKTAVGNHYIFGQTYSGSLLVEQTINCNASGETRDQQASSTNNTMITGRKFSKFTQDIDKIEGVVSATQKDVSTVTEQVTTLSETVEGIQTTVKQTTTIANDAKKDAETAQSTADSASSKADTAQGTANSAKETADNASNTATQSITLASEIKQTANDLTIQVSNNTQSANTNTQNLSTLRQTANAIQLAVQQNGDNIEELKACLLVKVDGVYVLAQLADETTDLGNLSYTKITPQGVDIYSEGDRVAYFRDKGTYSKDFITNGWHMQTANDNNSFNFIRKEYTLDE